MGEPVFFLQIVDRQGKVAHFPAGGPIEADFVEACVAKVAGRYVGILRTQKQVERAVRDAVSAAIYDLKAETRKIV